MRPAPFRLALRWPSLAVGLRPPRIVFTISEQHLSSRPLLPIASQSRPSTPERACSRVQVRRRRSRQVRRTRRRFRRYGARRFHRRQSPPVLHTARVTVFPVRRWLRSFTTTHRTLARGTPTPKMSRALKTGKKAPRCFVWVAARGLCPRDPGIFRFDATPQAGRTGATAVCGRRGGLRVQPLNGARVASLQCLILRSGRPKDTSGERDGTRLCR